MTSLSRWAASIEAGSGVALAASSRCVSGGAPVSVDGLPKPGASGMCWPVVCAKGVREAGFVAAADDDDELDVGFA